MVLAPRGHTPCGSVPCASVLRRALVWHDRCGPQGDHGTNIRREDRRAHQVRRRRDRPVTADLVQTRRAVPGLRRTRTGAIERQDIRPIKAHHRFERCASLHLPHHALARGTERLGRHRIEDLAPRRSARHALAAVARAPIARCPRLVTGAQRRRWEGNHGAKGLGGARLGAYPCGLSGSQPPPGEISNTYTGWDGHVERSRMRSAGSMWLQVLVDTRAVTHPLAPHDVAAVRNNTPTCRCVARGDRAGEEVSMA